jgi:hypothetical protein
MSLVRALLLNMFVLLFVFDVFAQEQTTNTSLKKILQAVESQHQVTFNYLEKDIENTLLSNPETNLSLELKIDFIEKKTNLIFQKSADGLYTISKKKKASEFKICGIVFSKITNSVLENANIQTTSNRNTTTNSDGYFEIITNNPETISISFIGYISKKINASQIKNGDCLNIYLETAPNELVEVATNRYLTTGITKTDEGMILLKPKKLGILPGLIEADLLLAMQQIPGISSVDESVSSINVRGGTNDQNLFLWNGIKMYQTGHFFGLISAFNPNLAHTITISKNGSSPFYGESVSSVIDISSTPSKSEKNVLSAGINMINADIYSKYNLTKKGFIEIAARKSMTEFLQTPTYKEYFDKAFQNTRITNFSGMPNMIYSNENKFGFYDVSLKYNQKIGQKTTLTADFITINDELDVLQKTEFNNIKQSEKNNLIQKNNGASVQVSQDWNPKNKSKIAVYASNYALNASKTRFEANQILLQENSILDTGIRAENNYHVNKKFTLNSGYQFNETGITNLDQVNNPIFIRRIKEVLRSHALIAEGKFKDSVSNISLNVGLRYNYFEKLKKSILEPRLQFNFGIVKNITLQLLAEQKSQTSFQIIDLQNDYFGIEKRRWILANDSIIPIQKSNQIALNTTYTNNNWLFSLENFYKKISGINTSGQGFQNQLEFEKINGSYTILGTEILVQKKINNFLGWISYCFNENKYNFSEVDPSIFLNNYNIKHSINWAAIFEKNNLKLALGSKWSSGKPITTPANITINSSNPLQPKIDYNTPNNVVLNSFFQVNFSSTYKWKNNKNNEYKIGFAILNIFNTNNEINEYYRINTTTNSIEDVKTFALGRTPNFSFRVSL